MNFHSGKINQAMAHKLPPTVPTIFSAPPPLRVNGQRYELGPVSAPHVQQTKAFEIVYFRQGLLTSLSALTELQKFCQHSRTAIEDYDSVRYIPESPDCKKTLQNLLKGLNYAEDSRHKELEQLDLEGLASYGQKLCNDLQINLLYLQHSIGKNDFFPNNQNTANPSNQFKPCNAEPQLQFFSPDRYLEFRTKFLKYKESQGWNEEIAKAKLIKNVSPNSPLNLNLAQFKYCTTSDIFGFWDEAVFPNRDRRQAFALANLRQAKTEQATTFVSRAKVLYRKHCAADASDGSLETDEALIFNLIRGLFDRQLVAFLVDKKVETITHLREIIDFYYHCVKPFPKLPQANVLQKGRRIKGPKNFHPRNTKNTKKGVKK